VRSYFPRILVISAAIVLIAQVAAPSRARAETDWSVSLGALFGVKPDISDRRYAGALTAQSEYRITGPLWFAMGARFAFNHRYFGWAIQPGIMLKFDAGHGLEPTLRAQIMVGSQHMYSDFTAFNYFLGGVVGPGLRFKLEKLSLFLEVAIELAGRLPGYDSMYLGVLPAFGFVF